MAGSAAVDFARVVRWYTKWPNIGWRRIRDEFLCVVYIVEPLLHV